MVFLKKSLNYCRSPGDNSEEIPEKVLEGIHAGILGGYFYICLNFCTNTCWKNNHEWTGDIPPGVFNRIARDFPEEIFGWVCEKISVRINEEIPARFFTAGGISKTNTVDIHGEIFEETSKGFFKIKSLQGFLE